MLFLPVKAAALNGSPESAPAVTAETTALPSLETSSLPSFEATASASAETGPATAEASPVEGASYKGVPWGADFDAFKAVKGFAGSLGPLSAAFVGSSDDNDIAVLLGVPVSAKDPNGEQRVMFEYVPRKFASAYFEPDDTYFIFYYGKFAMAFSRINSKNFDLYRDTFYKKYAKSGGFSKKYYLAKKKTSLLQAAIFEKGKTAAFLIKNQLTDRKSVYTSTKLLYASQELLGAIRKEIEDKLAADKLSGSEKSKHELEKDLNKIE